MPTVVERALTYRPEEPDSDEMWFVLNHAQLSRFAQAVVSAFGNDLCEVVVHDFRRPNGSISHISGDVTKRSLGGSMSQIGVAMMAEGDSAQDRINYLIHTSAGKRLRSSTVALRDRDGHVVGALCLNVDISNAAIGSSTKATNSPSQQVLKEAKVHFGNDVTELLRVILSDTVMQLGMSEPPAEAEQRQALVRALNERGFFVIRSAIPILAEYMGVSRGLIYHYLKEPPVGHARVEPSVALRVKTHGP